MKFTLAIFLIFISIKPSYAILDFEDHAFPELVTSARALAMGNAYINKVDDSWSAFYNPAGLGTVRKPQFHLANIHFEGSNGLLDALGDGPAYKFPQKYKDSFDLTTMRTALAKDQGKLAHSRINLFPNFTVRGLTLGYFYSQRNRSIINKDTANLFEVAERKDHGPVMALNASLFGGILKLGVSGIYVIRKDLYKSFGPTAPVVIANNDYRSGKSLQVTAGGRLTLPWAMLPTISTVLRNSTDNDFESPNNANLPNGGLPKRIRQTMDVGFSLTPQLGKRSRLHLEVNWKDVHNAYETNAKRRTAAGVELDFNRRIFLRGGYGDGWGSGGIGVRARTFQLDLTTYAVDRSLEDFRKEEDRRWVISFSSGF